MEGLQHGSSKRESGKHVRYGKSMKISYVDDFPLKKMWFSRCNCLAHHTGDGWGASLLPAVGWEPWSRGRKNRGVAATAGLKPESFVCLRWFVSSPHWLINPHLFFHFCFPVTWKQIAANQTKQNTCKLYQVMTSSWTLQIREACHKHRSDIFFSWC